MRGVPRIETHQPDIEGFSVAQDIVTDAVIVDTVAGGGAYPARFHPLAVDGAVFVRDVKQLRFRQIMTRKESDLPVERERIAYAGDVAGRGQVKPGITLHSGQIVFGIVERTGIPCTGAHPRRGAPDTRY